MLLGKSNKSEKYVQLIDEENLTNRDNFALKNIFDYEKELTDDKIETFYNSVKYSLLSIKREEATIFEIRTDNAELGKDRIYNFLDNIGEKLNIKTITEDEKLFRQKEKLNKLFSRKEELKRRTESIISEIEITKKALDNTSILNSLHNEDLSIINRFKEGNIKDFDLEFAGGLKKILCTLNDNDVLCVDHIALYCFLLYSDKLKLCEEEIKTIEEQTRETESDLKLENITEKTLDIQ